MSRWTYMCFYCNRTFSGDRSQREALFLDLKRHEQACSERHPTEPLHTVGNEPGRTDA